MCGIYGTTRFYNKEILDKKLEQIKFRGPDYSALKSDGHVTFAHVRLSIIDLSDRANQPLQYQHLIVVLNGEIYNYKTIKTELEKKGYIFNTTSDSEVLGGAYLEYGTNCVSMFNGMFSFAIYDQKNKIIFGGRDRLGKKPFYYSLLDGFEFCSQPSAIKMGRNDITIDEESIQQYLLFGHVPEPNSIYKEIKKIPPGTSFIYDTNKQQIEFSPYWTVQETPFLSYEQPYIKAKSDLSNLLNDAVALRLQSDVSLGTFLSGGIDSTLMTALCKKQKDNIEAFSIGFPGSDMDESMDAMNIAKHLNVKHTIIECNPNEGMKLIENITKYYDEPFSDSSAIPSMLLCQKAKKYITVAISGDGGDESFMGYKRIKWVKDVSSIYKFPQAFRIVVSDLLKQIPNYRIKLIAKGLRYNTIEDLAMSLLASQYPLSLIADFKNTIDYQRMQVQAIPLFQRISDLDLQFYLLNDCNVKVDRAAASVGVEVRSPLLDYRVVEFARNLPVSYRYQTGNQKRILRDILYGYVPKQLMDRPKKGFAIPLKDWFRNELKEYVYEQFSDKNLSMIPFLDKELVRKNVQLHMDGKINFFSEMWELIVLIQWFNKNE